jgi:hypothetical protein
MDYEELKKQLKSLDFNIKSFCDFLGVHRNNATQWKKKGVPKTIEKIIEGLKCKKELDKIKDICKNLD